MTKRTGGPRRKTRYKFKKSGSEKGRINIQRYMQTFTKGSKVLFKLDPSVHEGLYFRRFHGKVGIVQKQRGWCYEVSLMEGHKQKIAIVHPVHLIRCQK